MLRSLPTLNNAINAIKAADSSALPSSKKKTTKRRRRESSLSPDHSDEDEESDETKMKSFQSAMSQTVTRVVKTLRDMDKINLSSSPGSSDPNKAKAKSNQMEFIDDQCERLKASLPLEYYTRQLNHKRVYRQMIEIDERIEYTAKTWRQTMTEFSMMEAEEKKSPQKGGEKPAKAAGQSKKDGDGKVIEVFEYDSDEMEILLETMNEFVDSISVMTPEQKEAFMAKRANDDDDDDENPTKGK
ncbi:hypothetical protein EON65_26460 [archaeon]|nr:MAG: hypothetical protein EON65_26460 [archaeon]